jgi:hypothetical protein
VDAYVLESCDGNIGVYLARQYNCRRSIGESSSTPNADQITV